MAMASKKLVCRVCGKEYEACRSTDRKAGVFRWQEVACSPECGAVYLKRIEESRGLHVQKKSRKKRTEAVEQEVPQEQNVEPAFCEPAPAAPADGGLTEA